jgi:hypothetical protein
MKYFFFILSLFLFLRSSAQDCDEDVLQHKPGYWKAGMKGSTYNVTAPDLAKGKAVLAAIHRMIDSGYDPIGCQALYANAFEAPNPNAGKNWIAGNYYYSIYILNFLCDPASADKSKSYVAIATATTVNISANVIQWLNTLHAADLPDDDHRGYLKMVKRPVLQDGFYMMSEDIEGDSDKENKIKSYKWLITYDEKLPFKYVSRKEYLGIIKKKLEQTIKEDADHKQYYTKYMDKINEQLNMPESVLAQAAVCKWNDEERFEGFVAEGTPGSFIAVKPNLDYYRKNLAKSVPQFFTVVYKVSEGDPVHVHNINAIKQAVDFSSLRKMLGE